MSKIGIIDRPHPTKRLQREIFPIYIETPEDCPYNGSNCICRKLNEQCGPDEFNQNCKLELWSETK